MINFLWFFKDLVILIVLATRLAGEIRGDDMVKLALLLVLVVLCGCTARSGVISLSPDTFMAYRQQSFIGLTEADMLVLKLQAKVFQDANEYCMRQNKKILVLDTSETHGPYPLLGKKPRAEIRFKCL
jgi:ABC-type enterochelin transport system permease subunit